MRATLPLALLCYAGAIQACAAGPAPEAPVAIAETPEISRQITALPTESITQSREFLFLREELFAGFDPRRSRNDPVVLQSGLVDGRWHVFTPVPSLPRGVRLAVVAILGGEWNVEYGGL